ncbi:COP1-interacting protein 7-like isoform X6 [Populus nigra]|uniref:COP1-interacting protein 7-like isoform X6 n=1 Tax=Populus nigra TaxID=3691 RepID=UPI002B27BC1C|nr:COP1-interacting protein 7-like isoform X6 [Populus nigra]
MKSNALLDNAVFELSQNLTSSFFLIVRCDLFVSSNGNTEKLASGSVKPFISHLKFSEEQASQAVQSIKLEFDGCRNAETWFTKGTLERFVHFVSAPEVLEMVNTFDAEMSQLEAARKIYSQDPLTQGSRDQLSGALGGDGTGTTAGADATKKELLRAIDVRLAAVREDLATAYARASATGFNLDTVRDLQHFADRFGARRLNEACTKFMLLCLRRPDLINPWKPSVKDQVVRSSWGSDMSIDDPTEDESGSYMNRPHQNPFQNKHQQQQAGKEIQQLDKTQTQHPDQSKLTTCQQPDSSLAAQQQTFQNEKKEEENKKKEAVNESSTSQPSQPSRRLSVQDRINLFENKQKESSGEKPVAVGKSAELRRLSSDVSSASAIEKAVWKRWSGASDMSIDLGNDKKDDGNIDSPLCTPSSSFVSGTKSNVFPLSSDDDKDQKGFNDTASAANLVKLETRSVSRLKDQGELQTHGGGLLGKDEEVNLKGNLKDQVVSLSQLRSSAGRGEETGVGDQVVREDKLMGTSDREEKTGGVEAQLSFQEKSFPNTVKTVADKNQASLRTQIGNFAGRVGDVKFGNRIDDIEVRDPPLCQSRARISQTHTLSLSGQFEGGSGVKGKELPTKVTDFDLSASQIEWKLCKGEVDHARKENTEQIKEEDLEVSRMKVHKQPSSGTEQFKKLQGRRDGSRDESGSIHGINKLSFPGNKFSKSQESVVTLQVPSAGQAQRVRQSKGNQELNDELKMKANELEKLFAEHKLRVPGDQSSSVRRSKPAEVQAEQAESLQYRKPVAVEISLVEFQEKKTVLEPAGSSSDLVKFITPPRKIVDHQDHGSSPRQSFSERSFSDNSRGKFYERYMQKRDAKLREESGTKRVEKEAKLKAMQESLEQSRAEMKARFSSSVDRQNSLSSTRRRAEKLRSFNFHSSGKREQRPCKILFKPQPVESIQSEADGDLSEFPEQNYYGEDRSFSEVSDGDIASRRSQNKLFLNRYLSSPSPHATLAPVPRSVSKISNPSSGRRRVQSENPLVQSVPNFSDFRKENTKPFSGVSKAANRSQVRTYACSKSSSEEIPLVKEEKNRRSQSLRKSSADPIEFNDFPPLNSDGVVLAPLKFDQPELMPYDKFSKNVDTKPFLRQCNGIGPGSGATVATLKAMVAPESLKNEEFEESPFEAEESVNEAKEGEDEELETTEVEDCANMDNGKPRLSQDSDKIGMSGSENGDSLRSISQIDPSSVFELAASVPSTFHALGSLQDSPGESPVSWNSHMHHPFSYPHETSDIDAYVDSPIGSPASWNSHSLIQRETDAARTRKKWGSAQKPILVANSFNNQSRKDVTKGFKRLLKFGRKSRGAESLVDWISATTSEGDDDTEDGRDPADRSSEDLRKSRMGFSQGHPSDDGLYEIQTLNSSIPAPPANLKLRDDLMSGSSIKGFRNMKLPLLVMLYSKSSYRIECEPF